MSATQVRAVVSTLAYEMEALRAELRGLREHALTARPSWEFVTAEANLRTLRRTDVALFWERLSQPIAGRRGEMMIDGLLGELEALRGEASALRVEIAKTVRG
jgi:hypothetical protein